MAWLNLRAYVDEMGTKYDLFTISDAPTVDYGLATHNLAKHGGKLPLTFINGSYHMDPINTIAFMGGKREILDRWTSMENVSKRFGFELPESGGHHAGKDAEEIALTFARFLQATNTTIFLN